jgi:hypothetical protein
MLVAAPEGRLLWMSMQGAALMAAAFGSHWRQRGQLPSSETEVTVLVPI